jgi:N-acyl-D-aspartate/D-glutamate deacylase
MNDIVFLNGNLVDGKNNPIKKVNIAINDGKISDVSEKPLVGKESCDISGLYFCPGFIDVHTHSDFRIFSKPTEKLYQGVTTEVVGNCGFSAFNLPGIDKKAVSNFVKPLLGNVTEKKIYSIGEYISRLKGNISNSISILLGHGNLRFVLGNEQKKVLSDFEIKTLQKLLDEVLSIKELKGVSLGLEYPPGSFAGTKELISLCKIIEKHNKLIAIHLRSHYDDFLSSVEEAISLAIKTGVSLQISHLQNCYFEKNPDSIEKALEKIEFANEREKLNVSFDMYPYLAGSSVLTYFLPDDIMQNGKNSMINILKSPNQREAIIKKMNKLRIIDWSKVFVNYVPSGGEVIGKSLEDLSKIYKQQPEEVLFDILIKEKGEGTFIKYDKSENDLIATFKSKYFLLGSDSIWSAVKAHPRLYGSFIRFLKHYIIDKKMLSLEEAISKCTFFSAKKFNMENIGCIEKGKIADIVVLDINNLRDLSNFDNPSQIPKGVVHVLQSGKFSIKNQVVVNNSLGRVIR